MALNKLHKATLLIVIIIATVAAGYILGVSAAGHIQNSKAKEKRVARGIAVLKTMNENLAIGKPLPDVMLEDLDGNEIALSSLTCAQTVLSYIRPDCPFCMAQIANIQKFAPDDGDQTCFIIISASDPEDLRVMAEENNLHCPILYDREAEYNNTHLGVMSVPFNFVISKSLVLQGVIAGALMENDIREVVKEN